MAQAPSASNVAISADPAAPYRRPLVVDSDTGALRISSPNLTTGSGAASTVLNVTDAAVISEKATRLVTVSVIAPGDAGGLLVLNDATTIAGAAPGNRLFSKAAADMKAGDVYSMDMPTSSGLVVSETPTAAQFAISYGTSGGEDTGANRGANVYYQSEPPWGVPTGSLWNNGDGGLFVMGDSGSFEQIGYGW